MPDSETGGWREDSTLRCMAHSPKETGDYAQQASLSLLNPTVKRVSDGNSCVPNSQFGNMVG